MGVLPVEARIPWSGDLNSYDKKSKSLLVKFDAEESYMRYA